jgi:hypothetical protein
MRARGVTVREWPTRGLAATLAVGAASIALMGHAGAQEPPDAGRTWTSCVEHVPPGATRPEIKETFPERGVSGHAAVLEIIVTHGKGETVLPEGFKIQSTSDAARALGAAKFVIPEPDGGAGPSLATEHGESSSTTRLSIPFVPLPKDPGRNVMLLPPVPIAVARASGELVTVCTQPHPILVEDPIANEADPKVRPNPPPRPQREEWVAAKQFAVILLVAAITALITAWIVRRWKARPKPVPVVPPKVPWLVALEELDAIRRSSLLADERTGEYFDRVSDCVRKYLGARYGFDGLESTTDEMRTILKRVYPPVPCLQEIGDFLAECDLVKFARVVPAEDDCLKALARGESIVRTTIPAPVTTAAAAAEEAQAR